MRGMGPGDLAVHEYKRSVGILLEIVLDKKLMKNTFAVPWRYRVMWSDGIIKEHESGILRRVAVHNKF